MYIYIDIHDMYISTIICAYVYINIVRNGIRVASWDSNGKMG